MIFCTQEGWTYRVRWNRETTRWDYHAIDETGLQKAAFGLSVTSGDEALPDWQTCRTIHEEALVRRQRAEMLARTDIP